MNSPLWIKMSENNLEHQLVVNNYRMEIIDALLRFHGKSNLLAAIITLSKDPKTELMERYDLSEVQASALLDLRKPLSEISLENMQAEMNRLKCVEVRLKEKLS